MGINKKSIMFDINKYNKIMSHIDEYEDKDIKVTSLTDADIFDKIKDDVYSNEIIDEFHPRKVRKDNLEVTDWGFQIDPIGLRIAINEVWDRNHKPIIISENGLGTYDTLTTDKKVHDDYRIKYLKEHIHQMKILIQLVHVLVKKEFVFKTL